MKSPQEVRSASVIPTTTRRSTSSIGVAAYIARLDARVVGHADAKAKLSQALHHFMLGALHGIRHVLLLGPVGCGKSTLGKTLCAAIAPHPTAIIEHMDVISDAVSLDAPQNIIIYVRNIEYIVRDVKKLDAWLAECKKAGTIVVASAARSVTAVGLELMFDDVLEMEPLTKREIETAMVHPASLLTEAIADNAKRGVRIVLLPDAKRLLAEAAEASGRGMNAIAMFVTGLSKSIPQGRGDVMLDRAAVEMVLREAGVL